MTREHLDTEEKAQITTMAADGQSPARIAKQVRRSHHTVKRFLSEPETQRQVRDEKAVLAEIYRSKARRIVESISEEDIAKASLQQKSIASGVLLDKSLLLSGEATENIDMLAHRSVRTYPATKGRGKRTLLEPSIGGHTLCPRPILSREFVFAIGL